MRTGARRLLLSVGALVAVLVSSRAPAQEPLAGRILLGHPLTHSPVYALGDRLAPCDPASQWNGLDSVWFAVPPSGTAKRKVTLSSEATLDGAVFFWVKDGPCVLIQDFSCAHRGRGANVTCFLPQGTTHVTVEGYLGTGAFVLTIEE